MIVGALEGQLLKGLLGWNGNNRRAVVWWIYLWHNLRSVNVLDNFFEKGLDKNFWETVESRLVGVEPKPQENVVLSKTSTLLVWTFSTARKCFLNCKKVLSQLQESAFSTARKCFLNCKKVLSQLQEDAKAMTSTSYTEMFPTARKDYSQVYCISTASSQLSERLNPRLVLFDDNFSIARKD